MYKRLAASAARLILLLPLLLSFSTCRSGDEGIPAPSSREYQTAVTAFYVGLAALQAGDDARADTRLTEVTQVAPGEPAGWANLGLLATRQRDFDVAAERLNKARELAPENSRIYEFLGVVEANRGRLDDAIMLLSRAVELDPANLYAAYHLAQEVERQGQEDSDREALRLMQQILAMRPDNLAVQLEVARLAAKQGDAETLRNIVARIAAKAGSWPPEVKEQLAALQSAAAGPDLRQAGTRVAFLRNVLVRVADYRRGLGEVRIPTGEVGQPFVRFLKMPSPEPEPAAADGALSFDPGAPPEGLSGTWTYASAVSLNGEGKPEIIVANGSELKLRGGAPLPFPGGAQAAAPTPAGVLPLDFNYDFKTDLAVAGEGGFKLYRQESNGGFSDVTARARLDRTVTTASYTGAWIADIELDGDLDIVLGTKQDGPVVLRNHSDGTFSSLKPFGNVNGLADFVWADLDGDGDPDAALLDSHGTTFVFTNERGGDFLARTPPPGLGPAAALAAADLDGDGTLDLVVLQQDGGILQISDVDEGEGWTVVGIARINVAEALVPGAVRLIIEDLDNNGSLDLIAAGRSTASIWVSTPDGEFRALDPVNAQIFSAADLTGDGRLDLIGIADGQIVNLLNRGSKNYHWQIIRPRAAFATGDQRINSFGIGGEMEIRAGLLFQKRLISSPVVHFGLGDHPRTEVVRIVWPNGAVQGEFELEADQTVLAEQRLKGSCPSLFAFDGAEMRFVKDCPPWSPALGLRINLEQTAAISQTEEWVKIRGDQLAARDGYYDVRITAELWETYYIDRYALLVVDHPPDSEIYVDERTAEPAPKLAIYAVSTPLPVVRAWDDYGQEVTEIVRSLDGRYVDSFGRGRYQGITRNHYIEVEIDERLPRRGPLWLIAHGWMHPTDASINVAISQSGYELPRGLSLEVHDGKGGWTVARDRLGFPAGKHKTILVDLEGVFPGTGPRRFRLRTNMEIFWDALEVAPGLPDATYTSRELRPSTAELRYRGFSVMTQADRSSPEVPDYSRIAGTRQRWRDLIGYYTRFGDIRELVSDVDGRIVIANAGDEMLFSFEAPPPPPEGWKRDFVLIGNGWIKDGDFNSRFSKTVLPLPYLNMREYTEPPGRLEDDPVYRRHQTDWVKYHTRYVTAEPFRNTLRLRESQ